MKALTIVGARPQFVKAAPVSRALSNEGVNEVLLHTGQHYDYQMSGAFFDELGLAAPRYNLCVQERRHGVMTGRMLAGIEDVILTERPDVVIVYGDTNSTLAGALASAKLNVPTAHIEAGLRSFDRGMPEEQNRVVADHLASIHFCPTFEAVKNLAAEGISTQVHHVGDVMYDATLLFAEVASSKSDVIGRLGISQGQYFLATVHRAENTEKPENLRGILEGLRQISAPDFPVVFPTHPRTRAALQASGVGADNSNFGDIRFIEPVSFLDMLTLERHARAILTDSGGVQKEAYFHAVPCITLRSSTEWVETVAAGWNQVAGTNPGRIVEAVQRARSGSVIPEYGRGDASERIARILTRNGLS